VAEKRAIRARPYARRKTRDGFERREMVEAVGIEPSARPCNDKDLQQVIALNREFLPEHPPARLSTLAQELRSLSPEDRTLLAALLITGNLSPET